MRHKNLLAGVLIFVVSFGALASIARFTLRAFPNSADEYVYTFQAETFLKGRLWNATPPSCRLFQTCHVICKDGKWLGKYPVGWPVALAVGKHLQLPYWAINPLLGAIFLLVFYLFGLRLFEKDQKIAILSLISLFGTSFFLLNSVSFFSHPLAALLSLLAAYTLWKFLDTGRPAFACLGGACLGYLFLTRPYTALLITVPLVGFALFSKLSMRSKIKGAIAFLSGILPFMILHLAYNKLVTGSLFLSPFEWYDSTERIGFVNGYTLKKAFLHAQQYLLELRQWSNPFLLLTSALCLVKNLFVKKNDPKTLALFFIFVSLFTGYLFYGIDPGNRYGPRFLYEGHAFLLLYVICEIFTKKTVSKTDSNITLLLRTVFTGGLLWGLAVIPSRITYAQQLITGRLDLYDQVAAQNLQNAVVAIQSSTGRWYQMYPDDLTRNGTYLASEKNAKDLQNSEIIYSICSKKLKDCTDKDYGFDELHRLFPSRKIYRYRREEKEVRGLLTEITAEEYDLPAA